MIKLANGTYTNYTQFLIRNSKILYPMLSLPYLASKSVLIFKIAVSIIFRGPHASLLRYK